jgi:hypothetical protein
MTGGGIELMDTYGIHTPDSRYDQKERTTLAHTYSSIYSDVSY